MQEATPAISEQAVQAVLDLLEHEPEARTEFNEGLAKHIARISIDPGVDARNGFLKFILRWVSLAMLEHDDEWKRQVSSSDVAIAAGELGEPTDSQGLRALLSR